MAACKPAIDIAALYEQHGKTVVRFLQRHFSFDLAEIEEISQDAWLLAWQKRDTFRGECPPLTWVTQIAKFLAITRTRGLRAAAVHLSVDHVLGFPDGRSSGRLMESGADVRRIVSKLPAASRQAIYLAFMGFSGAEAAGLLGITERAFRKRHFDAYRKLRG
jgi:RNA polymerase sigma factor (sigma-70 family)